MKKIVLFCAGGLSSSLLVVKMREAAQQMNYDCDIIAHHSMGYSSNKSDRKIEADVVLLGPQINFYIQNFKANFTCPVEVIDRMDYGMVRGDKVLAHAIRLIQESSN